jgi:hypothetical protein
MDIAPVIELWFASSHLPPTFPPPFLPFFLHSFLPSLLVTAVTMVAVVTILRDRHDYSSR